MILQRFLNQQKDFKSFYFLINKICHLLGGKLFLVFVRLIHKQLTWVDMVCMYSI